MNSCFRHIVHQPVPSDCPLRSTHHLYSQQSGVWRCATAGRRAAAVVCLLVPLDPRFCETKNPNNSAFTAFTLGSEGGWRQLRGEFSGSFLRLTGYRFSASDNLALRIIRRHSAIWEYP